jgi:hypothetical protein
MTMQLPPCRHTIEQPTFGVATISSLPKCPLCQVEEIEVERDEYRSILCDLVASTHNLELPISVTTYRHRAIDLLRAKSVPMLDASPHQLPTLGSLAATLQRLLAKGMHPESEINVYQETESGNFTGRVSTEVIGGEDPRTPGVKHRIYLECD